MKKRFEDLDNAMFESDVTFSEILNAVEAWLKLPSKEQRLCCPWSRIVRKKYAPIHTMKALCKQFFPRKAEEISCGKKCPCYIMSFKYVREIARDFL